MLNSSGNIGGAASADIDLKDRLRQKNYSGLSHQQIVDGIKLFEIQKIDLCNKNVSTPIAYAVAELIRRSATDFTAFQALAQFEAGHSKVYPPQVRDEKNNRTGMTIALANGAELPRDIFYACFGAKVERDEGTVSGILGELQCEALPTSTLVNILHNNCILTTYKDIDFINGIIIDAMAQLMHRGEVQKVEEFVRKVPVATLPHNLDNLDYLSEALTRALRSQNSRVTPEHIKRYFDLGMKQYPYVEEIKDSLHGMKRSGKYGPLISALSANNEACSAFLIQNLDQNNRNKIWRFNMYGWRGLTSDEIVARVQTVDDCESDDIAVNPGPIHVLMARAHFDHIQQIRANLSTDVDIINTKSKIGKTTPLYYAMDKESFCKDSANFKRAKQMGAEIDLSMYYGNSPLCSALDRNNITLANYLVAVGADINFAIHQPNEKPPFYNTPLLSALVSYHVDLDDFRKLLAGPLAGCNLRSQEVASGINYYQTNELFKNTREKMEAKLQFLEHSSGIKFPRGNEAATTTRGDGRTWAEAAAGGVGTSADLQAGL